jgi:hypothetical protein
MFVFGSDPIGQLAVVLLAEKRVYEKRIPVPRDEGHGVRDPSEVLLARRYPLRGTPASLMNTSQSSFVPPSFIDIWRTSVAAIWLRN